MPIRASPWSENMPTYEYGCKKCGRTFELFQSITAPAKRFIKTECSQCNNRAPVERRIGTGGGLIFKGAGFYQTDYRSESYKTAAKSESDTASGKSEAASDGKSKKPSPDAAGASASPVTPAKSPEEKRSGGRKKRTEN